MDIRLQAISELVEKYFTLYSPLKFKEGYYFNKELKIYDNLFYLKIITVLNTFNLDNIHGLTKIK